jgi:hypothetical protein
LLKLEAGAPAVLIFFVKAAAVIAVFLGYVTKQWECCSLLLLCLGAVAKPAGVVAAILNTVASSATIATAFPDSSFSCCCF